MTTTAVTTAAGPILAIDLGKYKCVACLYDRATAAAEFRTIDTSRAEVERLVRRTRPAVVVVEACAPAGLAHDRCGALGAPCTVANTGGRGVEVPARQAEDGPGRRPPAGPAPRPRPAPGGRHPAQARAGAAGYASCWCGPRRPASGS
jgi:hypothetical protein